MKEYSVKLTLSAYRMVGKMIYPFMGPFLRMRARRGKEELGRRYERYGYPSVDRPEGPMIWFHAASVGETKAVIPLVEHMDRLRVNTVLTTGTVTSAEIVSGKLPQGTYHQYVPLDLEKAVRRFLDYWRPDLAIFTESEIWPATILELAARRIPQVLVNARMSDRSFARWSSAPALAETLFDKMSHVIAQSEVDADRFRRLGARPVSVCGNLKVDSQASEFDLEALERLTQEIAFRPAWIAASTHSGEEDAAMRVHARLKQEFPDILTIIVPRHPERADAVTSDAVAAGLNVSRRSKGDAVRSDTDIFLGDTIGEMELYLRLAPIVFMGRSLVASGGQNPLEPARIGTAILSGRKVHNFRDSYNNLLKAGGARIVRDEEMLAANVAHLLSNEVEREGMVLAARGVLEDMSGAVERTVKVLDAYVFPLTIKRDLEEI